MYMRILLVSSCIIFIIIVSFKDTEPLTVLSRKRRRGGDNDNDSDGENDGEGSLHLSRGNLHYIFYY